MFSALHNDSRSDGAHSAFRTPHSALVRGFTIVELLVVIAIIVILASLMAGLAGVTGDKKVISRTTAERERLATLIESYKEKIGVYPPDNPNAAPKFDGTNTLFYELAGATNPGNGVFGLRMGFSIDAGTLTTVFGLGGIVNSVTLDAVNADPEQKSQASRVQWLLTEVKPDQIDNSNLVPNATLLVAPGKLADGNRPPWFYREGTNAVHNPDRFDLWTVIKVRSGTRIIGNWKD